MLPVFATLLVGLAPVRAGEALDAHLAGQTSPDGRFVLRATAENGAVTRIFLVTVKDGREVADLSNDVMLSEAESTALVWTGDSESFAANFRAGGRHETTAFFRWNGKAFARLESPEQMLRDTVVIPARKRELQADGQPEDTNLRRIWDAWKAVGWKDDAAEIHGETVSSYQSEGEGVDIAVAVDATVSFDKDGKAKILKAAEVPASD